VPSEEIPRASHLGLGTGTLGSFGSSASAKEVSTLLDTMLARGITAIDTADAYGSGQAERLLGSALRGRHRSFFLMTKAGYRYGNLPWPLRPANAILKRAMHRLGARQCFTPEYLERCLKQSLKRLGTDRVDVFFLHDPSLGDLEKLDFLRRLGRLRSQGMTGCFGVSSGEPEVIEAALSGKQVDFIQSPANLADAGRLLNVWNACEKQGVRIVANHVMGRGDFGLPELTHEIRLKAAAALLPSNSIILCGTRNASHLAQADQWAGEALSRAAALNLVGRVAYAESI
jgi:pyridoxine 4-dehydrogenase